MKGLCKESWKDFWIKCQFCDSERSNKYIIPFSATLPHAHLQPVAQRRVVCDSEAPTEPFHRRTHHNGVLPIPAAWSAKVHWDPYRHEHHLHHTNLMKLHIPLEPSNGRYQWVISWQHAQGTVQNQSHISRKGKEHVQ